jgi:hypothetical protein
MTVAKEPIQHRNNNTNMINSVARPTRDRLAYLRTSTDGGPGPFNGRPVPSGRMRCNCYAY